jgi:DNA-binding LacI/PurR family transcriptional regulator
MVQGTVSSRVHAFDSITREKRLMDCRILHCSTINWENSNVAAYRKMKHVWDQPMRPTAVFTTSDHGALGVLKWCSENGIRVPQDLSVLGFDNDDIDEFTNPPLTTIAQPYEEIARKALLVLDHRTPEGHCELLPPSLVIRESTAPPSLGGFGDAE